jgi:ubiquinone/menaquinone biosynthesis C-methylase UbiE
MKRKPVDYRAWRRGRGIWLATLFVVAACSEPLPSRPLVLLTSAESQPPQRGERRLFSPTDLGLLESDDRYQWQRIEEIFDYLQIADRSVVADVAAGGGWFAMQMGRRVGPEGIVYAEEIQPVMIQAIRRRMQTEKLTNIVPVLGSPTDPHLPKGTLDAITIVNAFRDIETPVPLLERLRDSLNNRGLLGVVDFTPGGGGPGPEAEERVAPEMIIASAKTAGLRLVARYAIAPFEFLLVFAK